MQTKILGLMAVALLAGPMTVNAIPVTWTLQGVQLASGGSVTGSFTYDADTNGYSNIAINTPRFFYTPIALTNYAPNGFDAVSGLANGSGFLQLVVASSFTNAGGVLALVTTGDLRSFETTTPFGQGLFDDIVSGQVSSVPEPGTLALLGLGLVGLGVSRRKKAA